jgi:hypothetical protein
MTLILEESDTIVDIMLDRMSRFGINYKVSKNNIEPKTGVIPQTDIDTVEKTIADMEADIENDPDMAKVEYLMDLYAKAVEFYSATNNPKYEIYKEKIHNTLATPRMTEFLDTEGNSKTPRDDEKQLDDEIDNVNNHLDPVISVEEGKECEDIEICLVKQSSDSSASRTQKYAVSDDDESPRKGSEEQPVKSKFEINPQEVTTTEVEKLPEPQQEPKTDTEPSNTTESSLAPEEEKSLASNEDVKSFKIEPVEEPITIKQRVTEPQTNDVKTPSEISKIEPKNEVKIELADDEEIKIDYNDEDEDIEDDDDE